MDKKQITAVEAKQLADTSEVFKKRIYKCIKETATEGMLGITYGIENPSMVLIKAVEADLIASGFEVSIVPDEKTKLVTLVISWDK